MDLDREIYGDYWLSAWADSESTSRIQSRNPVFTKKLRRLDGAREVAYSVTGCYLRVFAVPYTIDWVAKNIIAKFTLENPRKTEGREALN